MAKKNLINADMLLATPRKAPEPTPQEVVETPVVLSQQQFIAPTIAVQPEVETNSASAKESISTVKKGLKVNETRATFIVDENLLEKLKAVAYWERLNIKDVINDAFQSYIDGFEKQYGIIKPVPNNRKA